MLTIKNLEKSFWSKVIFDWANMSLWSKIKAWLVWSNGTGKSTLLRILAWEDTDYNGQIVFDTKNPLIGYMKQQVSIDDWSKSLYDFLREYVGIDKIEDEINLLLEALEAEGAMEKYTQAYEIFEKMWGYSFESLSETTLHKLWLWKYDTTTQIKNLSGWEKNKLLLCATLLKWGDLLLLDEPTNNLDSWSIEGLISFLRESVASCLIISHDRDFLNGVVTKVFEIDDHKKQIVEYGGNYDLYEREKWSQHQNQLLAHQRQQEEFDRIEEAKKNLQNRAASIANKGNARDNDKGDGASKVAKKLSRAASTMANRIEQMDKVEKPMQKKPLELMLDLPVLPQGGIEVSNLKYVYPSEASFQLQVDSFSLRGNDKVLISWDNGQGKSTFVKLITANLFPSKGSVNLHPSINIGYFSQEQDNLNMNDTPISFLESKGNFSFEDMNFVLAKLWFDQEDRNKRIEMLSPGMKSRLIFALISLRKCNCLIFDEPTNHVDIETIKELEKAINEFKGMVVVVTHDKKFIEEIKFTKRLDFRAGVWVEKNI